MLDFAHSRLKPFKHQEEDTEYLVNHPYLLIASEMRTGKTKIVIDAAQFLYLLGEIDKIIVVAPSPVRDVWYDPDIGELQKHLWNVLPARITEYHSRRRAWLWRKNQDDKLEWVITNFEFIRRKQHLKVLKPFCDKSTLLVGDESSFIKNANAGQTEAFEELRWLCARVVLLNGTPISHSPQDLFSQSNILHPSILNCKYITHFRSRYATMMPILGHDGKQLKSPRGFGLEQVSGWKNLEDLQQRLAPYVIRRLQKDCLDLPPKLDPVTMTAELTPATWALYKQMRDEFVILFEGQPPETPVTGSLAQQAVVQRIRLAQITSGFLGGIQNFEVEPEDEPDIIDEGDRPDWLPHADSSDRILPWDDHNTNTLESSIAGANSFRASRFEPKGRAISSIKEISREKLDVLLWFVRQRLEQEDFPHLVTWCRFRPELARLMLNMKEKFPQFLLGEVRGGQKKDERNQAMKLLHPDSTPRNSPVFVGGTFGTGAYGLNFTGANVSLNMSYDHSLGKYKQAGDRVYGPGMRGPVAYFNIAAVGPKGQKTYDHIIIKARQNREDIADWTTGAWVKALKEE